MVGMQPIILPSLPTTGNIFFGEIIDGAMQLSKIGSMAENYWRKIPKHFPFVQLNEFIVMPNHIHGIIIIDKPFDKKNDNVIVVETQDFASLRSQSQSQPKNVFGPQSKNLASIIRGYKIGVTKNAKQINPNWQWQSRFYDHIIRNEVEFKNIKNYIINNPKKWNDDNFN